MSAIVADTDLPADQQAFIEINARYAVTWPVISQAGTPLPDAEQWADAKGQLQYLLEVHT